MKSLYGPLTLLAGLAMISTAPFAADKIGVATSITNEVTSTIDGDTGEVAIGDGVFQNQTFGTAQDSRAQLLFIDETVLTIEAGSSVTVEVFEYDFDSNAGKMTLSTTEGAFQLIMGSAAPSSYTIKTPVATARGRDAIIVWRFGDGKLTTVLMRGVADVTKWRHGSVEWLDVLSGPVFIMPDGTSVKSFRKGLKALLDAADLRQDERGVERDAYSFRHYYATQRLLRGVSVYTLAENMGTSVAMIEKHYGHVRPELAADELTKE